jgi:hypothetical protein
MNGFVLRCNWPCVLWACINVARDSDGAGDYYYYYYYHHHHHHHHGGGTRWRSWLRHCATSRKVAGSIPDVVIKIFHKQYFRPHYSPGIDSASKRNEYQEYMLGVKAAGA